MSSHGLKPSWKTFRRAIWKSRSGCGRNLGRTKDFGRSQPGGRGERESESCGPAITKSGKTLSRVWSDLAETHAASGALMSQCNIDYNFSCSCELYTNLQVLTNLHLSTVSMPILFDEGIGWWVRCVPYTVLISSVLHGCININMTYAFSAYDGNQPTSLPTIRPRHPVYNHTTQIASALLQTVFRDYILLHRWSKNKGCPSSGRRQSLAPPWFHNVPSLRVSSITSPTASLFY